MKMRLPFASLLLAGFLISFGAIADDKDSNKDGYQISDAKPEFEKPTVPEIEIPDQEIEWDFLSEWVRVKPYFEPLPGIFAIQLRAFPRHDAKVLELIPEGTELQVFDHHETEAFGRSYTYYLVESPTGKRGWIDSVFVEHIFKLPERDELPEIDFRP